MPPGSFGLDSLRVKYFGILQSDLGDLGELIRL